MKKQAIAVLATATLIVTGISGCSGKTVGNGVGATATASAEQPAAAAPAPNTSASLDQLRNGFSGEVPADLKDEVIAQIIKTAKDLKSMRVETETIMNGGSLNARSVNVTSGTFAPEMALEVENILMTGQRTYNRFFLPAGGKAQDARIYASEDGKSWHREDNPQMAQILTAQSTSAAQGFRVAEKFYKSAKMTVENGALHLEFDPQSMLEIIMEQMPGNDAQEMANTGMEVREYSADYDLNDLQLQKMKSVFTISNELLKTPMENILNIKITEHNSAPAPEEPKS